MKRANVLKTLDCLDYLNRSGVITKIEKKDLVQSLKKAMYDNSDEEFYALARRIFQEDESEQGSNYQMLLASVN